MLQLLMKLLPLLLLVQVHAGQIPLNQRLRDRPSTWRSWGPFPIGTRELPLLPPLKTKATMLSPLVPGGAVSESEVKEDADGWVATGDERIS